MRAPFTAPPGKFDPLKEPTRGDQIFAQHFSNGRWDAPIAITAAGGDHYRTAVTIDRQGRAWVFWSQNVAGNFDLHARSIENGRPGAEVRISTAPGSDIDPGCSYGFERESVGSVAGLEEWQSRRIGLLNRLSECFLDGRSQSRVRHSVREMVAQRVYGLALGYEDLNDHEQLREIRR